MKKTSQYLIHTVIASLTLITAESVHAASFIIDTFSQGTQFVQRGGGVNVLYSEVGNFPSSIVGGYRDLFLTNTNITNPNGSLRTAVAGVDPAEAETLSYSNTNSAYSRLEIAWDGMDNSSNVNRTGLGGVDLTQTGSLEALVVSFISADQSLNATLNIWDMNNNMSTASFTFGQLITNQTVNFVYNASDFNSITGNKVLLTGTANLTNVGAIQLLLRGQPDTLTALDAEIDIVQSSDRVAEVPEPSAVVGLGIFILGVLGMRNSGRK